MGFSVIRNRLFLTRGDSAEITLIIRDRVTGAIFKRELSDEKTVIEKHLDRGILRRENDCVLILIPEDTAQLPFGTYWYDVELVLDSGYTDTIIPPSPFIITGEVTTHG